MLGENGSPHTPEWQPRRCTCTCLCAGLNEWATRRRERCGCCYGDCHTCQHGPQLHTTTCEAPLLWEGDNT